MNMQFSISIEFFMALIAIAPLLRDACKSLKKEFLIMTLFFVVVYIGIDTVRAV